MLISILLLLTNPYYNFIMKSAYFKNITVYQLACTEQFMLHF